ncbi:hypothetical protein BCR35DRAFT_356489 [Leucosporidium creatinivorum]|uniref:Uncharacterized protein n=1 Tax=Leucosporidium creatinivorum TaxID=106004 RepID=A0A1Y2BY91_9BASI|nr:hypothetical protein BCR35DRAFT_356489 [Leucosporidium creatinivorum]
MPPTTDPTAGAHSSNHRIRRERHRGAHDQSPPLSPLQIGPKRTKQNATPISDTLLTNPALSTLVRTLRIKVDVAREVAPPTDDSRGSRSGQDDELLGALVALNLRIEEFVVARAQEGCFNLLSSIPGLQRLEFVGEEFGSSEWRLAPTPPESFPFQLTALITPLRFNYGAFQSLLSNSATSLIHLTADICLLIQLCNPDQQSFDRRLPPLPSLSSLTLIVNDFDVTHDTTNLIAFLAILPSLHTLRLAIHEHVPDKESVNLHLLTGLPSSVVHVDLSRVYIDKVALLKYLKKPGMGLKRLSLYPEHFERAGESEAIGQTCEEKGVWIRWC